MKRGDIVLYHAAAGGVGLMFGQWAKHLGATVIGTAGSADKMALAKAHGYDHVINYRDSDFVAGGEGNHRRQACATSSTIRSARIRFPASLDCLKPMGMFVSFGQSSGPIPPFSMALLSQKGSLFATRPTLFTYIAKRADLETYAAALFDVVGKGIVKVEINQRHALADAAQAHADIEARRTTGTRILIP